MMPPASRGTSRPGATTQQVGSCFGALVPGKRSTPPQGTTQRSWIVAPSAPFALPVPGGSGRFRAGIRLRIDRAGARPVRPPPLSAIPHRPPHLSVRKPRSRSSISHHRSSVSPLRSSMSRPRPSLVPGTRCHDPTLLGRASMVCFLEGARCHRDTTQRSRIVAPVVPPISIGLHGGNHHPVGCLKKV